MTPRRALFFLAFAMDWTAILSLLATGEIPRMAALFVFAVFALSVLLRKSLQPSGPLLAAFVALAIGGSLWLWLGTGMVLLVAVAIGALVLHSILWWIQVPGRGFALRAALGFVEILIAAIITSDLYLVLAIFLFAVLSAQAISCAYLVQTQHASTRLPAGYLTRGAAIGAVVLLSGILIFPILPRTQRFPGSGSLAKVGYTESVGFTNISGLTGDGAGKTALRVSSVEQGFSLDDLLMLFPLGLFRGRVLSVFDGETWAANPRSIPKPATLGSALPEENFFLFEVWREPLGSAVLPLPYGVRLVSEDSGAASAYVERLDSGEFLRPHSMWRKTNYSFVAGEPWVQKEPPPSANDLFVPEKLRTNRLQRLVETIFPAGTSDDEAVRAGIDRWFQYLKENQFTATVGAVSPPPEFAASKDWHALEHFLFLTRTGHCEEFAGSTALILRLANIPARIVAGFRISRAPVNRTLHLREGDAHAWVEYWRPKYGWAPLDPTPRILRNPSFWNDLRSQFEMAYDFLDNYWYRYVVAFSSRSQLELGNTLARNWRSEGRDRTSSTLRHSKWVGLSTALLLLGFAAWLLLGRRSGEAPATWTVDRALIRERLRMEALLKRFSKRTAGFTPEIVQLQAQWTSLYLRTRFGPRELNPIAPAVSDLKVYYARLRNALRQVARQMPDPPPESD